MVMAIINLVFGIVAVAAGISGKFKLIGTDSGAALVVVGAAVAGYGVYGIVKAVRAKKRTSQ